MASTTMKSPEHLRGKISQVKHLLDDASKRLQDEASKYAANIKSQTTSMPMGNGTTNTSKENVPTDLIRTISDINTLKSVLSCPIFDRIVNVTDSLDKLSYHLNLHPSIGPSDINFDPNGELILAPPIESMATDDFMNNRLNGLNGHSLANPLQVVNGTTDPHAQSSKATDADDDTIMATSIAQKQPTRIATNINGSTSQPDANNFIQQPMNGAKCESKHVDLQRRSIEVGDDGYMTPSPTDREITYNTEKLVSNGNGRSYITSSKGDRVLSSDAYHLDKPVSSDLQEASRLYKSNGHFALNEVSSNNTCLNANYESTSKTDRPMNDQLDGHVENDVSGYSNELYNTTHGQIVTGNSNLTQPMDYQKIVAGDAQNRNPYAVSSQSTSQIKPASNRYPVELNDAKTQSSAEARCHRSSCSPSTSGDSTVRMADECDSGASSYQSQAVRNTQNIAPTYQHEETKPAPVYPVQQQNNKEIHKSTPLKVPLASEGSVDEHSESMDQELIEKLSPEMERIKVTLEKDSNGLGITIAGYTCEKEEISGIFIKSITPNSPAFKSGKIRTLDQIFAVNGRELLGYSNPEAVNVLRNTGKRVTLELMRYLAESKYKKLQTALAHAVPSISAKGSKTEATPTKTDVTQDIPTTVRSSDGNYMNQDVKRATDELQKQMLTQVADDQGYPESLYKNTTELPMKSLEVNLTRLAHESPDILSSASSRYSQDIKIAKPAIGTNKVIETKQGARNTIDIRPPACQTSIPSLATYVNKPVNIDSNVSSTDIGNLNRSIATRLHNEESVDFGISVRPEWEEEVQIIELQKDPSQGLGFTVKEYVNPKDPKESIIMIRSITPGGVAEQDGRLSSGDLLMFVDDVSLRGASLSEAVKTLKRVDRQVNLGVFKLKRQ